MEYFTDVTNLLTEIRSTSWPADYGLLSEHPDKFVSYKILSDFILPTGLYDPQNFAYNWALRGTETTLCLSKGDIIQVCSMMYVDSDKTRRVTNVCIFDNKSHSFGLSADFFIQNPQLFENITKQVRREYQLIKILN